MDIARFKKIACEAIDAEATLLHKISKEIWNNPELGYEEYHAHKILTEYLETKFSNVEKSFVCETGFRATATSGTVSSPHIAVLCEFDALPNIGHACGHNLIAEAGIGASIGILAAFKAGVQGKLSVLGTPAEEGAGGKIQFINKNVFNDIDAAMMVHPQRKNLFKHDFLSVKHVNVTFTGKAAHASAAPWEGVNALDAAIQAYTAISTLRQQMKPQWRVHGIITNGGAKPNIIPEKAEMAYYIRAPTESQLKVLIEKIYNCFKAAALSSNCQIEINDSEAGYKNLVHNEPMIDAYSANILGMGEVSVEYNANNVTGSTDMGNVSHEVPSIHPMFALKTNAINHTREFTVATGHNDAQEPTLKQAKAMAMTAIDLFCKPELLSAAKEKFKINMALSN